MRIVVASILSLAASIASAATCGDGELRVARVPAAATSLGTDLRDGDVLSAHGENALCTVLDLAAAELDAGTRGAIALRVRRGAATVDARLPGGRVDLELAQQGVDARAQASRVLLDVRALAAASKFPEARARLAEAPKLAPADEALLLEQALVALDADPDRAAGKVLAERVVVLRKDAPPLRLARALAIRGRLSMQLRDAAGAEADAKRALALLGDESTLVAAQAETLLGALDYIATRPDDAERWYRQALRRVVAIAPGGLQHAGLLSNLGALDVARGRPDTGLASYDEALALLAKSAPGSYLEARIFFNRGLALTDRRRLGDAEKSLRAAIDRFAKIQPGGPEQLQAQAQLADVLGARGQYALAESALRELLPQLRAREPDGYNTLAVESQLGLALVRLERWDEAGEAYRALLARLPPERPDSLRADVLGQYALVLVETGKYDDASAALDEALASYQARGRTALPSASTLYARGELRLRQERVDDARADATRALAIRAEHAPGSVLEASSHFQLGRVERAAGNVEAALAKFDKAIALLESERGQQADTGELRALWASRYADFYREPLDLLLELDRLPQAFELDQRYRGRELAASLGSTAAAVRPGWVDSAVDVATARQRLAPEQALVSMVVRDDHTWLLLLDREHLSAQRIAHGRGKWEDDVGALAALWALPEPPPASQRALVERSHALYRDLLAPAEPALRDAQRLLLQPDGALHDVAFAALVTDVGEQPGDARYLVERFALATALRAFASATPATSDAAVLAFGDAGTEAATVDANVLRLRDAGGGPLPAARVEAERVASAYGTRGRALLGAAAREDAVRTSTAGTLHFASHVVVDPFEPLESYVRLAAGDADDGRLYGREIVASTPTARSLVVLAGCASRQGAIAAGEGLLGLARAWHVAGASRVVGSQWPVADASTADLMIALHHARADGVPDDVALALAQREMLAEARKRPWWPWSEDHSVRAGPFHWAAFTMTTLVP